MDKTIERKIDKLEQKILNIDEQLDILTDDGDPKFIQALYDRKRTLENELAMLTLEAF